MADETSQCGSTGSTGATGGALCADPDAGAMQVAVLGDPGQDNAVLVTLNAGESIVRLLFDCGAGCLERVRFRDVQQIDAVLFSHFHMDHVSGFDAFVRANFDRERPVRLFGPRGSHAILQHRLRGFLWDLVAGTPGRFQVTEIDRGALRTIELRSAEGFAVAHDVGEAPFTGRVLETAELTVDAAILDHGPSDSIGYVVRQKARSNVDRDALARLGSRPGPWLRRLTDERAGDDEQVVVGERARRLGELRRELLVTTSGDSVGYLTDFRVTPATESELLRLFSGCRRIVCENNYRDADVEIARRNHHMTSSAVGELARRLAPERLLVFHVTDRYDVAGWRELLGEVRARFAAAWFPSEWRHVFGDGAVGRGAAAGA